MYSIITTKLALDSAGTSGQTSDVTLAVPMEGGNNAIAEITIFNITATSVTCQLQESNDRENWKDKGSSVSATLGYQTLNIASIAAAYVRVKFTIVGSGKAIVAAGINVSYV